MKAVPNIISIFRIILVPVFAIVYFTDDSDIKIYAILIFAVAGLSDCLDGFLARRLNAQSKLGKLLDPLGDKLMTFTAMICITITRPILVWAVVVFFVKEVLMGIGGLLIHKKAHIELPPANFIGKTSTVVFFFVCVTLLIFGNHEWLTNTVAMSLISAAIGLALIALVSYLLSYVKIMKTRQNNIGELECNQHCAQDADETLQ